MAQGIGPIDAFDVLYALAADGECESALFGTCAPLAREALRQSPAAGMFSWLWFEVPLTGSPRFDLHVAYSADALREGSQDPSFGEGRYDELFRWYAEGERGGNGLALAYDIGEGRIENPAVHINVNEGIATDMKGFFDHAAGPDAYQAYRDFEEQLPKDWSIWYAGVHPGRPGSHLRVDCFASDERKAAYAADNSLLVSDLRSCGFESTNSALVEHAAPILESPFALELQFDIARDGTVGSTIGISATFATYKPSIVKRLFGQDGAAETLMAEIERMGLADERWRHIPATSYAKPVTMGDGRMALCCVPTFVKLRLRDGQPLDAKMYLQATAAFL